MSEHFAHATISKAGEVDFPLWVKGIAALITLLAPLAIAAALWQGNQIFDIAIRVARIETRLAETQSSNQAGTAALAKVMVMETRIERLEEDLQDARRERRDRENSERENRARP